MAFVRSPNSDRVIIQAILLIAVSSISEIAAEPRPGEKIIVTQENEDTVKGLFAELLRHQEKVSYYSYRSPYFDCEAYHKLLKCGLKTVPYLCEGSAWQAAMSVWVGSAAIRHKDVRTPEEVYAYNLARKQTGPAALLPLFSDLILMELLPDDMKPACLPPATGYVDCREFSWSRWWQEHKHRFVFQTAKPPIMPVDDHVWSAMPQIKTTVQNGLLDIYAVSATYHQMIERAAAEMNIGIFIGEEEYIDIISTVRMKAVTFEEFLYIIGRTVSVGGFDYRKTEDGYWIGGKNPAKPRAILSGWGIMMDKTVFSMDDRIPVTVLTRLPGPIVDPADPVFPCYGSFRVTTNDGRIVQDYRPTTKAEPNMPLIPLEKDIYPIRVFLDDFGKLPFGEYNVRFRYLNHETPSVAVEIYNRPIR